MRYCKLVGAVKFYVALMKFESDFITFFFLIIEFVSTFLHSIRYL